MNPRWSRVRHDRYRRSGTALLDKALASQAAEGPLYGAMKLQSSRLRSLSLCVTLLATAGLAISASACVEPEPAEAIDTEPAALIYPTTDPVEVRAGSQFTCARRQNGTVTCWGRAWEGQAGDGITPPPTEHLTPETEVLALGPAFVTGDWLALGGSRACLRTKTKNVSCWGTSTGAWPGGNVSGPTPALVPGLTKVDEVAVAKHSPGWGHPDTTCARSGGGVVCWGGNQFGLLATGTADNLAHPTPTPVAGLGRNVAQIALGETHACARFNNGTVTCWGKNYHGQLGNGTTTPVYTVGAPIAGLTDVVQLSLGSAHTCALQGNGQIKCWGLGGVVGDGSTVDRLSPRSVTQLIEAVEIAAGEQHTCARMVDDSVQCWGQNWYGQLGLGDTNPRLIPYALGLEGVEQLTVGFNHTCALTDTSDILCWGTNWWGELGDGTGEDQLSPTPVLDL